MPIVVPTPTGNTGRIVVQTLLEQNESVRVLVRDPVRLDPLAQSRCEIVVGDLRDPGALAQTLDGAEAAFFCVPQSPDPQDISVYYQSFAQPFAIAARQAEVQRIVAISGGDGSGSGFQGIGQALHAVEQTLAATGIACRYVRCGYFMENFFWMIESIARAGVFSLPVAGTVPIPFVSAFDIGTVAGQLLADRQWTGQAGIAAHGAKPLGCDLAAQIATEVLEFPVRFQTVTGMDYKASLAKHGVSEAMGQSLVEMFVAISAGQDMAAPVPDRAECPTTLQQWMTKMFKPVVMQMRSSLGEA